MSLGIGLRLPAGKKHWLNDVETANVGVFLAGDPHDSIYVPGSLYAVATLPMDRLEEIAAGEELVLDRHRLGGSGVHARGIPIAVNSWLEGAFDRIHANNPVTGDDDAGEVMLTALVRHLALAIASRR